MQKLLKAVCQPVKTAGLMLIHTHLFTPTKPMIGLQLRTFFKKMSTQKKKKNNPS